MMGDLVVALGFSCLILCGDACRRGGTEVNRFAYILKVRPVMMIMT